MLLDENLQFVVVAGVMGTHAIVEPARKLLVGEMPYEQGMQLLEQRSEPDDPAMRSKSLHQCHQLPMLVGELAVDLLERGIHDRRTRFRGAGGQIAMGKPNLVVGDVMSRDVFTLERNDKLSVADDVMKQRRIRHIPVLDRDGDLCGIITQRDLFRGILLRSLGFGSRAEERMLDTLSVKDAMHEDVITTSPDTPLADAADSMLSNKIGCLPVVEGGRLVGLISEADFVKQFAGGDG